MKILLIDNYDSFTYNLVHYIESFDCEVDVVFNNCIDFSKVDFYDKIVLSPGPGLPIDSGELLTLIQRYKSKKPILGVCLGFQALFESFGGGIYNQSSVKHGVSENCEFNIKAKLFKNLPSKFKVGLYHSWAVNKKSVPAELLITAKSQNDIIMAFEHKSLPVCGVQFHPESVMTENGYEIINNFLLNF